MRWADVTTPPSTRTLRQFAGLCLVVFVGLAGVRVWRGQDGAATWTLAVLGLGLGLIGLWRPAAVRWVYSGWMIATFPIGWTISKVILGVFFLLIFTPIAVIFRLMRRDALHLHRGTGRSYWTAKSTAPGETYFRQS